MSHDRSRYVVPGGKRPREDHNVDVTGPRPPRRGAEQQQSGSAGAVAAPALALDAVPPFAITGDVLDAALREVDPDFVLQANARMALLAFVDDFLCSTIERAARLAWVRGDAEADVAVHGNPPAASVVVTPEDVQRALALVWGL